MIAAQLRRVASREEKIADLIEWMREEIGMPGSERYAAQERFFVEASRGHVIATPLGIRRF